MTRQVLAAEAQEWFRHPSQCKGFDPADLHDDGLEYWVDGPVCGMFRDFSWPRVLDVHCGVKPEGWGRTVPHAQAILHAVWDHHQPDLIVALTHESNRATLFFNRRIGFKVIGTMPTPEPVIIQGWKPCQQQR